MFKGKQTGSKKPATAVRANGESTRYDRTRAAAGLGIGTAKTTLGVLDGIIVDQSEAKVIDPHLILKVIGRAQTQLGLAIRAAAEARRNPKFRKA